MNLARRVGLHIRLVDTLREVGRKAERLEVPFFQTFLVRQLDGHLIAPTRYDRQQFLQAVGQNLEPRYLHASYYSNLCAPKKRQHFLVRELRLAQRLGFTHVVIHPGCSPKGADRQVGIDQLARALNNIFRMQCDVDVLLENTAHGNRAIGSDITDFGQLLEKLDFPERVQFCLDTAHAHSYGYDIVTPHGQDAFIALVDEVVGLDRVGLLHLNDTNQRCGSKIDRHATVGDGVIGPHMLQRFMNHAMLKHVRVILELPPLSEKEEAHVFAQVCAWCKGEHNDSHSNQWPGADW